MQAVNSILTTIRPILEAIYFIASTCLVATVVIGLIQLNLFKKDLQAKNKRAAVEKSLEYLNFYSSTFLPGVNDFRLNFKKEVPNPKDTKQYFNGEFLLVIKDLPKEVIVEVLIKSKLGLTHLFNQLEFFSSAMLNGVAEEELVYKSVSKDYCEFLEKEYVLMGILRSGGTPYQNTIELYNKWKKRMQVQEAELQKQLAEQKITQIGDTHMPNPPIGL